MHPNDEYPQKRGKDEFKSQFLHGNVNVEEGEVSLAFVFRSVIKTLEYDSVTGNRVVNEDTLDKHSGLIANFNETVLNFSKDKTSVMSKYVQNMCKKFIDWGVGLMRRK